MHSTSTLPPVATPPHRSDRQALSLGNLDSLHASRHAPLRPRVPAPGHGHRLGPLSPPGLRQSDFERWPGHRLRARWRRASPPTATSIRAPPLPAMAMTRRLRAVRTLPSPMRNSCSAFKATSTNSPRRIPASPSPSISSLPRAPVLIPTSRPTTRSIRRTASPRRAAFSEDQVRQLIQQHVTGRQLGLLGEPRVNVLALNLDLDRLCKISFLSASPGKWGGGFVPPLFF